MSSVSATNTSYDTVLYPSYTHVQTHPSRLAVIGTLCGLSPAHPAHCRVLELGCGDGSNLVPMAWALPQSEFVGVDLATVPISRGCEMINDLGLRNIRLAADNITSINGQWGKFDYIIAHGLYSWVPTDVRDALLRLCRELLSPQGVAFISYNALPGGHLRTMIREMMLFHVRGCEVPEQRVRQARALAQFVSQGQHASDEYRAWMKSELDRALEHEPGYLYHDHLAEINEPCYFTQFAQHASAHGLQFLAEADYFEMSAHSFGPEIRTTLEQLGSNRILREQYLDFLKCRRFRQTLLCHAEVSLRPARPEQVMPFEVTCPARNLGAEIDLAPEVLCAFQAPNGARCETDFALGKAALAVLIPLFPSSLSFDQTLTTALERISQSGLDPVPSAPREELANQLAQFLLSVYSAGLVDFRLGAPRVVRHPGAKPAASPVARWQIQRRNFVTSLFHLPVQIEDEIGRNLLLWLDGTLDRSALLEKLWELIKAKGALKENTTETAARADLEKSLDENLQKLARMGLLVT